MGSVRLSFFIVCAAEATPRQSWQAMPDKKVSLKRGRKMNIRTTNVLLVAAAILGASGCSQFKVLNKEHRDESEQQVTLVDEHSSYPAIRRPNFEQINIIELVDPRGGAKAAFKDAWDAADKYESDRMWGARYDLVFAYFRDNNVEGAEAKRVHRNNVQDRILGVSTSRCNVFKNYLRRQQTEANFILGSATTIAASLGALLPGVHASRNLAGTAGIFSGVEAEYDQQYFGGLAAHVIVQGIEVRQNRLLQELTKGRQLPIEDYSMEAAIRDAVFFDGSCSTLVGLSEAAESIREATNPGLERAAQVVAGAKALREITQATSLSELESSGKLQPLLNRTKVNSSPLVVSMVKSSVDPSATLTTALAAPTRINDAIAWRAAQIGQAFIDAQGKLADKDRSKLTAQQISEKFTKAMSAALDQLPISACVALLPPPAAEVTKQLATIATTKENSAARLTVAAALDKAKADLGLAVGRTELLVSQASVAIDSSANKWITAVSNDKFDETALGKLDVTSPSTDLKDLCKAPAPTA